MDGCWVHRNVAMEWNLPITVLLNHHTCSTYSVDIRNILYANIISVDVQYPNKLFHNDGK